jgi:hypothetical protein
VAKLFITINKKIRKSNNYYLKIKLMTKVHEILVSAILPAIKSVSKLEMETMLSGIKQRNGMEVYVNTLCEIYSGFSLLKETSIKTRTRINDGIVDLVLEVVKESAINNKISLSRKEIAQ